jgi:ATP-dependent Clp protease ATP-binding subunit ClpC
MGSFIFLGPTGVGKTELVKVLAKEVFGSEDALIKIDMSEFMERHNVSRLVGAPAGYVGYDEGGKLTESVRRNPYSVILFDEIEKAHPEVFNILLQILEDGYLSDAKGRRVDFRNTIIILTSNVGASELQKTARLGFRLSDESDKTLDAQYEEMKQRVLEQLRDRFKPEFLNRLDQIVVFRPLTRDLVGQIVDLQLTDLAGRLRERDLKLTVDKKAKLELVVRGFDPEYGARPVRRAIQTNLEDPIAEQLLSGKIKDGDRVQITFSKDNFSFTPTRSRKRSLAK